MSLPSTVEIRQDLQGATYVEFVNYAFATAATGFVVVRNDIPTDKKLHTAVEMLKPYILSEATVTSWPGTELHGGLLANLYVFPTLEPVRLTILKLTDHLYGWQQPELPEDPGFFDREGAVSVSSTIHEEYLAIHLDDIRERIIRSSFPNLFRVCLDSARTES